jgi:hypothetical protein
MILRTHCCSSRNSAFATGIVVTALLIVSPASSQAASLITDRASLQGNDQLDWSTLGFTPPFKFLPNNFSATSVQGLPLNVQIPPTPSPSITPPLVFQTLPPPTGIPTNFAKGDFILLTGLTPGQFPSPGNPGPITISFNQPVFGAGAQVAVDDTTNFTASIAAFDRNNKLLGQFSLPGTSSLALDNSAQFLGIRSDTANIASLVFSSSVSDRALGINTLSIDGEPVPEPSTTVATLMSIAWFGRLALTRKRRIER